MVEVWKEAAPDEIWERTPKCILYPCNLFTGAKKPVKTFSSDPMLLRYAYEKYCTTDKYTSCPYYIAVVETAKIGKPKLIVEFVENEIKKLEKAKVI